MYNIMLLKLPLVKLSVRIETVVVVSWDSW